MPLYFFSVRDGRDIADDAGVELKDDDSARAEALRSSVEMIRDFMREADWSHEEWRMDITEGDGRRVASLKIVRSVE